MVRWIFEIIVFILLALFCCMLPFLVMSAFYYIYFVFVKKKKPRKAKYTFKIKKRSIIKRLFFDFPKRFVLDRITHDPDEFGMYGFHLFVGEQGSGKSVALTEMLNRIKKQYTKAKIATNYEYIYQDSEITSWKDLVFNNNGIYGQVDVIDEVQNWFSCNQSKDFPPEMIQEITQQRKQRKILVGTTQRFERMAKPLREQVNYLYYPVTLFGCITTVKVVKPKVNPDGMIEKERTVKRYFFIHSDELRNSFDTYHKIKKQAESGFHTDNRAEDGNSVNVYNVIESKPRRKR